MPTKKSKAIYKITNLINGKIYIGQSIHPWKRWWEHRNRAKNHYDAYPIHLAINKYGENNFEFEIIEWCENYNEREIELIKELNTICPNGYNVADGGEGNSGSNMNSGKNSITMKTLLSILSDLSLNQLSDQKIADKFGTSKCIVYQINRGLDFHTSVDVYPIRKKVTTNEN